MSGRYCPWVPRKHIMLRFDDDQGYTQICMLCGCNIRSNFHDD
jgi:hypothetical protein